MALKVNSPLVSVDWLFEHLEDESLLILDATIPKVGSTNTVQEEKIQIKNALFFDLNDFSDATASLPNTMMTADEFQKQAINFGINTESCLVVYDDLGIYSSPRVWWMFQLMGFTNIAVLDGGFKEWKLKNYPTEKPTIRKLPQGNFKANYQSEKIKFTNDVLDNISSEKSELLDARSEGRFFATEPEPRNDVKGGRIPNSIGLPHSAILSSNKMKSVEELKAIFNSKNIDNKPMIFSCGSGITASVLALGAEIAGFKNHSVYDGSWTEWGTIPNLPIEK